jgi:hypothetical protein
MYLARIQFKFDNGMLKNKKEAKEYAEEAVKFMMEENCYRLKLISLCKMRKEKKDRL